MAFSSRAVLVIGGSVLFGLGLVVAAKLYGTADPTLSGEWSGTGAVPEGTLTEPALAYSFAGIKLTLDALGTFRLVDGGLPLAGRWRRTGNLLTFDVETLMERPLGVQPETTRKAADAFQAKVSPDGSEIDFRGLSGDWVTLKRSPVSGNMPD